jgi:myo-inositol 2-dehydrogenase/D-chiro-inositol 1-dehydrogenase
MSKLGPATAIPYGYSPTYADKDKYNVKRPMENAAEIKLGAIGLGGIALAKHLPAIRRLRDTGINVAIVAGAETDAALRTKVERLHGFPCYASASELFDAHAIDGVLALTDPGEGRLAVLNEAVRRGVHIFTEKPFLYFGVDRATEAIAAAREIVAEADRKGLTVMIGLVKQFSPPYQVAKSLLDAGKIGDISMLAVKMCQGWSRHILLEGQACHVLHISRWFAGEIARLTAMGINRFAEPNYPYDNIVVNAEFASGAIGTFYFNSSSPSLKPWERVEVFGERKWLSVEDGAVVSLHDSEEGPTQSWSSVVPHTLLFDEEFGGYVGELRNFIDAIRYREPAAITGQDGIAALILADMIHTSIRQRRPVESSEWATPAKAKQVVA